MSDSSVGVVTVSYNGLDHLRHFVSALEATSATDPVDRLLVVNNASTDGTGEWLDTRGIETITLGENNGFAKPNNLGIRHLADCNFVAILNNDTAVEEGWLAPLLEVLQREPSAVMTGAVLTDWSGERLDFGGGVVSYTGHAHHLSEQEIPPRTQPARRALFACGGAALVRRETFLSLGGFDEDFFAYFEDVDFGWRAWLAGYEVWIAYGSRVRHRHQGTASRLPFPPRMRLYERNALATVLKNYGDDTVWQACAGALLSLFARSVAYSPLDVGDFAVGGSLPPQAPPEPESVISGSSAAQLLAVEDIAHGWDLWMGKRASVQALRRRPDRDILPLFGDFAVPPLLDNPAYEAAHRAVIQALGIDEMCRE
ncbi:glycosyltransferase family 2 protein [Candidatus Fermentibacteria bacterium]|nr:glycosyltransferase family 2 protein [Candidatus Fermentibacteria bacterium]